MTTPRAHPGDDSADAQLSAIAQSADAPITSRARAMTGLAVRRTDGAVGVLRTILLDRGADGTLRRAAARALADGFAEPEGGPAMAALAAAAATAAWPPPLDSCGPTSGSLAWSPPVLPRSGDRSMRMP